MNKRHFLKNSMRFAAAALIATASFGSLQAVAAAPIKIGVAAPLTGPLAKMGQDIANGVKLAVDEINAKGGVKGQQIQLITGDDKSDPREGVIVANKLVNSQVVGVIGHLNSGISIPTSAEVYSPNKVTMISPASTNPTLTERRLKGVFRTIGRDDQQGKVAAQFALKRGWKNVVILHNKNAYGQGLAEEFMRNIKAGGGQVMLFEGITSGDKDFSPIVTKVRALRPQAIFFGGEYQDGSLLIKQSRNQGIMMPILGGDGLLEKTLIEIAGKRAATNIFITGPGGTKGSFAANYRGKFSADPGVYSGYAYDATRVLLEAVKKAGDNREAVIREVGKTKNFQGVTGSISFNPKGDLMRAGFSVWEVKGDNFQEIH